MSNALRSFPAAALTLLAGLTPGAAAGLGPSDCQSLVVNGSFESTPQPVPDESFQHFSDIGAEDVAGWRLASGTAIEFQRNLNGAAADGEHWIELASSEAWQAIPTASPAAS